LGEQNQIHTYVTVLQPQAHTNTNRQDEPSQILQRSTDEPERLPILAAHHAAFESRVMASPTLVFNSLLSNDIADAKKNLL
jgi:hypothetical protein